MRTYSRYIIYTAFVFVFLFWPKPAVAYSGFWSDLGYDDPSNTLSGYSLTWQDWWDAYNFYCAAWEWDPFNEQEYCVDQWTWYSSLTTFTYLYRPSSALELWGYTIHPVWADAGFLVYPPDETEGYWTTVGDHYQEWQQIHEWYDYWEEQWRVEYFSGIYQMGLSGATAQVRPRITVSGNTIWYFNGANPSGYPTSVQLTSTGGAGTTWTVAAGANKINLSPTTGESTTVTSSGNEFSTSIGDIQVRGSVNGVNSLPVSLTTRVPGRFTHLMPDGLQCDTQFGYLSFINYEIRDNLNDPLPSVLPLNENWTDPSPNGVIPDFPGTTWVRGPAAGGVTLTDQPAVFFDRIGGELPLVGQTPTPVCGDGVPVQHWGQEWRFGSGTVGGGYLLFFDTLRKYSGHAEHTID